MATAINSYLNPASYSEAAVAEARSADLNSLPSGLRLIRLMTALQDGDADAAGATLAALETEGLVGYELFQLRTAALLIAVRQDSKTRFDAALDAWLAGRAAYPVNWNDDVLDAPEFADWLTDFDRSRLFRKPVKVPKMTKDELTFVKDLSFCITRAVQDNVDWLRQIDAKSSIADMIDKYRLVAVNLDLKEATLDGRGKLPDLIVALDDRGGYAGSFLAH
jgi:hypothetical protein